MACRQIWNRWLPDRLWKEEEINTRVLIYELLDFVDDVVDQLGSRHRLAYVHKILEQGTGADRQLKVYEDTKNLVNVADYIQNNFLHGISVQ